MVLRAEFPSTEELTGAVQGTLLYLSLYLFVFIPFQSFSKFYLLAQKKEEAKKNDNKNQVSFREAKYYNSKDPLALVGDRTVGNFLEFAIVFMPLLWLHALFVDPGPSFKLCLVYTLSRAYYPLVFPRKGMILLSTFPNYLVIFFLLGKLHVAAFF